MTGTPSTRRRWLDERRLDVRQSYDEEAPDYDRLDSPISPTHQRFVTRLIETCPPDGLILDMPCGTGKYFGLVVAAGRRVVGADQSPGMLAVARAKDLASEVLEQGLQELAIADRFDAAMSIDALENIPPEDWPTVLANLRRAIHPGGHLYLTVEEVDPAEIDAEFAALQATSAPAVHGEIVSGDTAGYHYYPGRSRVDVWLAEAGFSVVDEGENRADGYGYRHLLTRRD